MELEEMRNETASRNRIVPASERLKALLFLADKVASHRDAVMKIINDKTGGILKMAKRKALFLVLEKIAAQSQTLSCNISQKVSFFARQNKTKKLPLLLLAGGILMQTQGHCSDSPLGGLDSITTDVMQIIFGPVVRKSLLAMAAAWGVFQAATSGSFKPILFWGGIGLAIAYVPKLIEIIANVG